KPLLITSMLLAVQKSTSRPPKSGTSTLPHCAHSSVNISTRASGVKSAFFEMLVPPATVTWSTTRAVRWITSRCPCVTGSKDPGQTARVTAPPLHDCGPLARATRKTGLSHRKCDSTAAPPRPATPHPATVANARQRSMNLRRPSGWPLAAPDGCWQSMCLTHTADQPTLRRRAEREAGEAPAPPTWWRSRQSTRELRHCLWRPEPYADHARPGAPDWRHDWPLPTQQR